MSIPLYAFLTVKYIFFKSVTNSDTVSSGKDICASVILYIRTLMLIMGVSVLNPYDDPRNIINSEVIYF